jgi:chemotaxis signal transduction protein
MDEEQQVVIFQVGKKCLALRLQQVEHILSLGVDDGIEVSADSGAILFQGQAITWQPLWAGLAEPSVYQSFDDLAQALPQRRQDHIDWMASLEQSLLHDIPFAKARSPYECAFGKWFYAFNSDDRRLSMLLSQFEAPHARIHGLADRLLTMCSEGEKDSALAIFNHEKEGTLALLLQLFDNVLALLPHLKRPVALIVNDGNGRHALGIDRVLDICDLAAEDLRPAKSAIGRLTPVGFVVRQESNALIPLLDVAQLIALH